MLSVWQHQVPIFMCLSSGFDHFIIPEECNYWYSLILGERASCVTRTVQMRRAAERSHQGVTTGDQRSTSTEWLWRTALLNKLMCLWAFVFFEAFFRRLAFIPGVAHNGLCLHLSCIWVVAVLLVRSGRLTTAKLNGPGVKKNADRSFFAGSPQYCTITGFN